MDLLPLQYATVDVDTRCAVMIAADQHEFRCRHSLRALTDKAVKHLGRLGGRDRFVINIARDHDGIWPLTGCQMRDLGKNVF